jgi:hypothetical protein
VHRIAIRRRFDAAVLGGCPDGDAAALLPELAVGAQEELMRCQRTLKVQHLIRYEFPNLDRRSARWVSRECWVKLSHLIHRLVETAVPGAFCAYRSIATVA